MPKKTTKVIFNECVYCKEEGLDLEPAVMCDGHFNNTMAIAQDQIDALVKEVEHLKKGVQVYQAYTETRYTFFAEKENKDLVDWIKENDKRMKKEKNKKT